MSQYFKMKKSIFLEMFNLRSVYFTIGSPPKDNSPQLLTESLLSSSKHEQYFNNEPVKIKLSGKNLSIIISNTLSEEEKEKYDFKIYKNKENLIEHCDTKLSKKEYNKNTISLVNNIKDFFADHSKRNYSELYKKETYFIPETIYIQSPILKDVSDFDKLKEIKEVYIVTDLLKGEYKTIDIDEDSIYYLYNISFHENEVVVELQIKLNFFGEEIELKSSSYTEDGFILETKEKLFTNKNNMHRAIKRTLDLAQKNWDKNLGIVSSVDY